MGNFIFCAVKCLEHLVLFVFKLYNRTFCKKMPPIVKHVANFIINTNKFAPGTYSL